MKKQQSFAMLFTGFSAVAVLSSVAMANPQPALDFHWRLAGLTVSNSQEAELLAPYAVGVTSDGTSLTGLAGAGNRVTVRNAVNGAIVSSGVAPDGSFEFTITPALVSGMILHLQSEDSNSNLSNVTSFTVPSGINDATGIAVENPTITSVSPEGGQVYVNGGIGDTVYIYGTNDVLLGSGMVDSSGSVSINLSTPVNEGQEITFWSQNNEGLKSDVITYVVPPSQGVGGALLAPTPENIGVKGVFEGHESAGELFYSGIYQMVDGDGTTRRWHLFIQDPNEHAVVRNWGRRLLLTATSELTITNDNFYRSGYDDKKRMTDGYYVSWKLAINPNGKAWSTAAAVCTEGLSNLQQTPDAWFLPSPSEYRHINDNMREGMLIDNQTTRYWSSTDFDVALGYPATFFPGAFNTTRVDKDNLYNVICARRTMIP